MTSLRQKSPLFSFCSKISVAKLVLKWGKILMCWHIYDNKPNCSLIFKFHSHSFVSLLITDLVIWLQYFFWPLVELFLQMRKVDWCCLSYYPNFLSVCNLTNWTHAFTLYEKKTPTTTTTTDIAVHRLTSLNNHWNDCYTNCTLYA